MHFYKTVIHAQTKGARVRLLHIVQYYPLNGQPYVDSDL